MIRYLIIIWLLVKLSVISAQSPLLDSLKNELKNTTTDSSKCAILSQLIENEWDIAVWPNYNSQIKAISEKHINDTQTKKFFLYYYAYAISNEGYYHQEKGNNLIALENYNKALEIQKKINSKEAIAASLNNIGYIYRQMGNIKEAINSYHQALRIQIEIKDSVNIATSYNNIGYVFENQGEFESALKYYLTASTIYAKIRDKAGMANCYGNIAYIFKQYGDPDCKIKEEKCSLQSHKKAIEYLEMAIKLNAEINDKEGLANAYNLLAGIYDPSSKTTINPLTNENKAFEYYTLALKLRQDINNVTGLSLSYSSLAEFLYYKNKHKEALEYGLKSLEYAKQLESPSYIQNSSELLSRIYDKLGMYQNSLNMFRLAVEMKDSIFNQETRNSALKKTFQIEYEKKAAADSVKVAEDKKVVQAQLKQERTQRFALYGGLGLVALFGIFMYNRFKVTQKQNVLIQEQKTELQKQKELVEEHQKETLDSIHYAKRIQSALISNSDFITQHIPDNFIYFNPKDIVSGDFYWASHHNDKFYLAVCDSTGHGVPGAFMSLLNMGFLSEAIKEKNIEKPHEVFNYVRERLINTISDSGQKDGMDGILLCIDKQQRIIEYAAANNEPILIQNNHIIELPKDKMPIGIGEKMEPFVLHSLELNSNEVLYLYTDGFADQFGGPNGKKFKYKQLNDLLLSINTTPLSEQKNILETTFNNWKGTQEQVDDVLIIGIKI